MYAITSNYVIDQSQIANNRGSTNPVSSKKQIFLKDMQPLKVTQQAITNQKIICCNHKLLIKETKSFVTIPKIKLSDGTIVADYSKDADFAARMELMTLDYAESIRAQVNKYPNEFPMPCMAITANALKNSLYQLKQQFCLTVIEQDIFNQLEIELNALSPQYPYKKSLIVTYKYLLYKSFLEFKFQLEVLNSNRKDLIDLKKDSLSRESNNEIFKELKYLSATERMISSIFFSNCTLSKIKNLPWHTLLDTTNAYFIQELSKIYFSMAINREFHSAFYALSSNEILIPYTNKLNIAFFNKTWCLPLWLVGCSLEELILVDDFYMNSSVFFEHDLFHLSSKLCELVKKQPFFECILQQVRLIYQNKQLIKKIKFEAIELAIFYIFHETGLNNIAGNFNDTLEHFVNTAHLLPLYSLDDEYALVSSIDMKNGFQFVIEILINNNINAKFISKLSIAENNTIAQHLLDVETGLNKVYYNINYETSAFIDETINDIKYNKKLLAENNFNASLLISIIRRYTEAMHEKIKNKSVEYSTYLQCTKIDKQVLYQLTEDKRHLDFIMCFIASDKTLGSRECCNIACRMLQKNLINCV